MEFELSDSTKRIREAHRKNFDKYIKGDNVKHNKETAQKLQKEYIKRFEFIFSEQFIPLLACFDGNEMRQGKNKEKSKEAICLTLEYIDKILALAPPKGAKERSIYYEMLHTFCVRKSGEVVKGTYALLKNIEDEFGEIKERRKALTQKEKQWVYKKMGWEYPKEFQKRTPMELREWINHIMQDNFNRLFDIWKNVWEQNVVVDFFIEGISLEVYSKMEYKNHINLKDLRIYSYIVQYLKHIAQKGIEARKLKLQVKECFWSKEWIEDLRHIQIQFHPLLKPRKTRFPQVEVFSAEIREESIITHEKNYLGNNKEFEKELQTYLKEIKKYLANNQK